MSRCETTNYDCVGSRMMFDKANRPSICTNHTAGFTGQKGGTRIPTRLIVKVESGSCSGRDDATATCCMLRSWEKYCTYSRKYVVPYPRGYQCGCIWINYKRNTQFYVHTTQFLSVRTISVAGHLLAVCLHFAVLTCTRNCCVTVCKVLALGR